MGTSSAAGNGASNNGDSRCGSTNKALQAAAGDAPAAAQVDQAAQQLEEGVAAGLGLSSGHSQQPAALSQPAAAALASSSTSGAPVGQPCRPAASACVAVCTDKWACSSQGGWQVLAAFWAAAADLQSEARQVEVVPGMCLGVCKAAPNVRIVTNGRTVVHSSVRPGSAWDILQRSLGDSKGQLDGV
jgi:hypothetical protein